MWLILAQRSGPRYIASSIGSPIGVPPRGAIADPPGAVASTPAAKGPWNDYARTGAPNAVNFHPN